MSSKSDRVRLSRTIVASAADDRALIEVTRRIRGCDPVQGFVVGVGVRWLVLHRLSPDLDLDGYTAVRWKHLDHARRLDAEHVAVRALDHQGVQPSAVALDATTTGSLLRSAADVFGVVAVHPELRDPTICWVGDIVGFATKTVVIDPIDADGRRSASTIELPFDLLTRVDLGLRYQTALAHAADVPFRRIVTAV